MDYTNLGAPDGTADNMGGTTQRCYFAPISAFASIKTPTVSTTLADIVKIIIAHTFNTGKCFNTSYITMDKGQLQSEPQGETDGKSLKQKFTFFYPGSKAEAHGFAAQCKNDNFIFLIEKPDSATSGYEQVGTEMFPAKITPKFDTGTNSSGVRGYTFEVEAMTDKQYIYTAAISTTPAP